MQEADPQTGSLECPDKVVRVKGGERAVDGVDGVIGFELISERANETGHRWHTVGSDGSVHRVIDRWLDSAGDLIRIERYCPNQVRVADGDRASEGAIWTETNSTYVLSGEPTGAARSGQDQGEEQRERGGAHGLLRAVEGPRVRERAAAVRGSRRRVPMRQRPSQIGGRAVERPVVDGHAPSCDTPRWPKATGAVDP